MNLERLIFTLYDNWDNLNKKKAMFALKYHIALLNWKRKKLKLGLIVFEVKEIMFHEIVVKEIIDIRYIRQDNTVTDELKLETRLKAIAWKWDFKNVTAFVLVFIFMSCHLYNNIYHIYCLKLPSLAFRSVFYDYVVKFGFEAIYLYPSLDCMKPLILGNFWLIDLFARYSIYFNLLF